MEEITNDIQGMLKALSTSREQIQRRFPREQDQASRHLVVAKDDHRQNYPGPAGAGTCPDRG